MLYEYAVEPELASTWHDRKEGAVFRGSFGLDKGRVVSRYPKHWKRLVWEAFRGQGEIQRKRMEEVLARLSEVMVAREAPYDGTRSWLENAQAEHARWPFRAVLACTNQHGGRDVITPDGLDEDEPRWVAPTGMPVPRAPIALAAAVAPMLRAASEIIFVDPHFSPTKSRYISTIEAFLKAVFDGRPLPQPRRIEIHHANGDIEPNYFRTQCESQLSPIIPSGVRVRIVRWNERSSGEKLHNRYILTDLGGVTFGIGLDGPEGDAGQTEDLNRLGREQYAVRWRQYAGPNPAFKLEEEFPVIGRLGEKGATETAAKKGIRRSYSNRW